MENLYQESGSSLSLKPEYQSAILFLCSTILEYFASAFTLGRSLISPEDTVENRNALVKGCQNLMKSIKRRIQRVKGSESSLKQMTLRVKVRLKSRT
jgi:hypothetical protein